MKPSNLPYLQPPNYYEELSIKNNKDWIGLGKTLIIFNILFLLGLSFLMGNYVNERFFTEKIEDVRLIEHLDTFPNQSIIYLHLNYYERKEISNMIKQTKPEYLNLSKQIIFIKNDKYVMMNNSYLGFNYKDGYQIYVRYLSDNDEMSRVFCHELLHSFSKFNNDIEELIVEDIDDTGVCFKKWSKFNHVD